MIFRTLDDNGDWNFGKGKNNYASLNAAIGLNIKTRILSWIDDCFFAQTAGIDWLNRLGSKNQKDLLELDLRRIITQSQGVTGILTFDIVLEDRVFTANYSVETIYSKSYVDSVRLEI